ncbi:DUF1674 domain-containing protein [Salinisphaera sp. T31B1]|uniref:DUF1674 domain-containing protein n=1 Tax=Salinisphaera sp. T31B1 TaxID=727963 RepID=UPI00333F3067
MSDERSSPVDHGETPKGAPPAEPGESARSDTPVSPAVDTSDLPREYGGRKGPEPVRYGDWEKNGRCIDF